MRVDQNAPPLSTPALTRGQRGSAIMLQPATTSLRAAIARGAVAGAVALVADREHDVLWEGAFGMSDIDAGTAMHTDSLFWAASGLSKPLTAAAAMMLVDEGKIRLDAPIEEHLPELGGRPLGSAGGTTRRRLVSPRSCSSESAAGASGQAAGVARGS